MGRRDGKRFGDNVETKEKKRLVLNTRAATKSSTKDDDVLSEK